MQMKRLAAVTLVVALSCSAADGKGLGAQLDFVGDLATQLRSTGQRIKHAAHDLMRSIAWYGVAPLQCSFGHFPAAVCRAR